ncbi:MAG: hypothetical protein CM1200mP20_12910 [Pseudomonadota bacterium]|nr:MAG: hypothetical protein CM1200mP20_12910 [Pseudomonadota bacterium]
MAEDLIGEPVYHFQSKLTAKDPYVGGAWEWHQDYGYWYYNGCLAPKMLSFMIALDRTDASNGCLKLVRGSHRLGRLDHVQVTPEQNTADPETHGPHPRITRGGRLRPESRGRRCLPQQHAALLRPEPLGKTGAGP